MHMVQTKLLNLLEHQDLGALSLRQIAKLVDVDDKPQIVKHHLIQLEKAGLIQINLDKKIIKLMKRGFTANSSNNPFYSIPIVGAANCGPASLFSDERVEGYLKVSSKLLPRNKQHLYVLIAQGLSMNLAEVREGEVIENGDFVIIDSAYKKPKDNDLIVAVIDNMAMIKRYKEDKNHNRVILKAESTENYLPIFLHEDDDFMISGKVIDIIKKPE
jgi:SOS-response transcriptional repressor LexA